MENIQWIFSGIGTEILIWAIGAIVGGLAGYKIGVNRSGRQNQKAKSGSKQRQELTIEGDLQDGEKRSSKTTIKQSQKGGKNSTQVQIGRSHDGKW